MTSELRNEDFHIANLSDDAKSKLVNLEEELNVTLVAYECDK